MNGIREPGGASLRNRPNIFVIAESRDNQRVAVPVFRVALRVSVGEKRGLAPAE